MTRLEGNSNGLAGANLSGCKLKVISHGLRGIKEVKFMNAFQDEAGAKTTREEQE